MKACPYCAEEIQDAAKVCRFCQRDLATGQAPTPTVIIQGPRWSKGIAAVLSLLIPGAGQMYKGEIGKGIAFLIFTVAGYIVIVPGLILHVIAIVEAASGDPNTTAAAQKKTAYREPTPAYREPTPEERRAAQKNTVRGFAVLGLAIATTAVIGTLMVNPERSARKVNAPKRGGSSSPAPAVNDTTHLDATDWATKLRAIVYRAGGSCPTVISTFHNGVKGDTHLWSVKCNDGESYAITLQDGRPAALTPCALAQKNGIECFKTLPER